ncbi:polysaccharide deacetylase family protein [Candidatus Solirubrobacter pratensis]|uniref:polysaccharide deacetylase family protein n=1 Tax=Candidatus Solirubrobacter pratensis TaxID=1298857 RepID=UPI0003F61716|nr:polysaccharide deacetylase family protein [Candidatus Solirubrobacter pratensis]
MKRFFSLMLIPLSMVPFVGIVPTIVHSHERFQREHDMGPLAAPHVALTAAERARYAPLHTRKGAIPVLAWHGIGPARDGYSTSRRAFARQLALLEHLGYTTISTREWAAFRAGKTAGLPAKPILLTFDDGRLDSYRGADAVLQRMGMRAAMFVITGEIEKRSPFYLTWAELHRMQDSGRWDIEPHAHEGHVEVAVSATGAKAPFYAARRFTRSQGRESLQGWKARVSADLSALRKRLAAQGMQPHAFAVPFGDYGRRAANDPRIPRLLSGLLTRQFGNFFLQADDNDPGFTTPRRGAAWRYELRTGTSLDDLYGWLSRHSKTDDKRN